jgi:formate-dependent nitrite reductase membrane component NrfD
LVRGSFIILGYSLVLLVQFILGVTGNARLNLVLSVPGVVLAGFTAMYTAFLFAQAKGRDLWQNPSLPIHLLSQAVLAGSATFSILALFFPLPAVGLTIVHATLLASVALHLALIVSEMVIPHPTEDAKRAADHMFHGQFKGYFWTGLLGGALVPTVLSVFVASTALPVVASVLALIGLLAYEHAYVQAGQSVPLS